MYARQRFQLTEGYCADAALRFVDDAFERQIIGRIDDQPHILGFLALIKAEAGQYLVRNPAPLQRVLKESGLRVRAVENREIVIGSLSVLEQIDLLRDVIGFFLVAVASPVDDLIPRLLVRPEFFCLAAAVVPNDRMRRRQNIAVGAIVLFELDHTRLRKIFFKVEDVADVCAAPLVDTLVIIADHAKILTRLGQQADNLVLDVVGILIFVHEDVTETVLIIREDIRIVTQHMQGVDQKVIKVHGVVPFELLLIGPVDTADHLAAEVVRLGLEVFPRADVMLLLLADCCGKVGLRIELRVNILLLHDGFYQRFLIDRIVHDEVVLIADSLTMLTQDTQAHGMKSHDPHARASADQLLDTFSHLAGRLIGEGYRQNLIGTHALLDQVRDAVRHRRGLPAARARQDQQRSVNMGRRLALFWIQMV